MTINQAYQEFGQIVNRNLTNNKSNVDKARFILLYNNFRTKYVEWMLEKRNEDRLRYVAPLLMMDTSLVKGAMKSDHEDFTLPEDFFDHSNLSVYVTTACGAQRLKTFEVKNDDVEELYHDVNYEPSLGYEETFYHLSNNSVSIYVKDFTIESAKLDYYRKPTDVDIEGYIRLDGTPSPNVHPELQDQSVRRILTGMAKAFAANTNDPTKYQVEKDQLFSIV